MKYAMYPILYSPCLISANTSSSLCNAPCKWLIAMGCVVSPFWHNSICISTWPFWEPSSSSPPSHSGWAKGLLRRNHLQQCCSDWTGVRKSCFKLFLTAQNYPLPQEQLFYASLSDTQLNCTFILLAFFHLTITLCHKNFQALIFTFF